MGLLGIGLAVAAGVVGTRIYDRVKEKNGNVNVENFVEGAKDYANEMVNKAPETLTKSVDVVMDKTIETAQKAKEAVKKEIKDHIDENKE